MGKPAGGWAQLPFRWVARAVCVNVVAWSADSIRRPPSTMLAWHRATIFSKCLQSADSRRKPFEQVLKNCSLFDDLHLLFYFFRVTFDPWIAAANLNFMCIYIYIFIYIYYVCVQKDRITLRTQKWKYVQLKGSRRPISFLGGSLLKCIAYFSAP